MNRINKYSHGSAYCINKGRKLARKITLIPVDRSCDLEWLGNLLLWCSLSSIYIPKARPSERVYAEDVTSAGNVLRWSKPGLLLFLGGC